LQLHPGSHESGLARLKRLTRRDIGHSVPELPDFCRIRDALHTLGHRAVCNDLRALEELMAADVAPVRVCVDDAFRHGGPHLAELLDHLSRMNQVRRRVDAAAAPAD
jgi:hypothetical protein